MLRPAPARSSSRAHRLPHAARAVGPGWPCLPVIRDDAFKRRLILKLLSPIDTPTRSGGTGPPKKIRALTSDTAQVRALASANAEDDAQSDTSTVLHDNHSNEDLAHDVPTSDF